LSNGRPSSGCLSHQECADSAVRLSSLRRTKRRLRPFVFDSLSAREHVRSMSGDQTSVMSSGMLTNRLRSESPVSGLLDSPIQTLATAAPGYRGGVYVINVSYSRQLRRMAPLFSLMLYIVNYLCGCMLSLQYFVNANRFSLKLMKQWRCYRWHI